MISKNLKRLLRKKRAKAEKRLTESQRLRNKDLRDYNIKVFLEREEQNDQKETKQSSQD